LLNIVINDPNIRQKQVFEFCWVDKNTSKLFTMDDRS
jgi:hypothetical protein